MAKNVFGLDIGSSLIKALALEEKQNVKMLAQAAVSPTPPKGIRSESPLDQEFLSKAIRELLERAKIDKKLVNVALPESQVFTRVIDVPNLSDKELSSAIHWEAEQYVPSPLSDVVLDYQVIQRPEGSSSGTMQVLLVAAPKTLIDKYKKILEGADLVPFVFETETLSMTRALVKGKEGDTILIVDMGATKTILAIVRKSQLVFTFSVPTGGEAITRAIASDFSFELDVAEKYKKTYGLLEDLQINIASAIAPIIKTILAEIEKGIKFYQEKYPSEQISYAIIAGGGAKLPGLIPFLAGELGIEVEIANPWNGITVDPNVFKETLQDGPIFTPAIGLALRDYE